jgi:predicted nucleic acid-binding protein
MGANTIVDAGFLVALLRRRDAHGEWAASQAAEFPTPWHTCDAVLTEAFYLLGPRNAPALATLLGRDGVQLSFDLAGNLKSVLTLFLKYAEVPMTLADACLVRMTELLPNPTLLTTDADFRLYRRHSRQVVPCVMP